MFRIGDFEFSLYNGNKKSESLCENSGYSVSLWNDAKVKKQTKSSKGQSSTKKDNAIGKKSDKAVTAYKNQFKHYIPNNRAKYNKVLKVISENSTIEDKDEAKAIANMICDLSGKYGIDAEIITNILAKESGGFVFTPTTMDPKTRTNKGVMQVDEISVKTIYSKTEDADNQKLAKSDRKIAYDHKYFEQDQKRIDQLKKKYPTAKALYNAIKSDVALGVELGIMVYKSKLHITKGDTIQAVKKYCGSSYSLPKGTTAVKKIYPVPKYKGK